MAGKGRFTILVEIFLWYTILIYLFFPNVVVLRSEVSLRVLTLTASGLYRAGISIGQVPPINGVFEGSDR